MALSFLYERVVLGMAGLDAVGLDLAWRRLGSIIHDDVAQFPLYKSPPS